MAAAAFGSLLLTGACGFFEQRFIAKRADVFRRIIAVDHPKFPADAPENVIFHQIDLQRDKPYSFDGLPIDTIIHVGTVKDTDNGSHVREDEVFPLQRLIVWAKKNRVRQFIYLSTTDVYGNDYKEGISEADDIKPTSRYAVAKAVGEKALSDMIGSHPMGWTILRLRRLSGPIPSYQDRNLFNLAASGCNFSFLGNGRNRLQLLHVDDLINAIGHVLANPAAADRHIFNVASTAMQNVSHMFQEVLDCAGYGKRVQPRRSSLILQLLIATQKTGIYSSKQLAARDVDILPVSIAKAEEILNFHPSFSSTTALVDAFRCFSRNKEFLRETQTGSKGSFWEAPVVSFPKTYSKSGENVYNKV